MLSPTDGAREAIVTSSGKTWTHAALRAEVAALADALARAGAAPGRVAAIALKDPAALLVAALAVWETGAVLAPLDTRAAYEKALARARPAVLVDPGGVRSLPGARAVGPEAGLLLFTSGSSGEPKGVLLRRDGILANIDAILEYLPVARHDRTAIVLPLVYSYALVGQAFTTLRAGGAVLLFNDMPYPAKLVELMARHAASGLSSVAASLRLLARAVAAGAPRPPLGYIASAGGPLDAPTRQLVREIFPDARLFNQYGLTEASPRVTACSDLEAPFWEGSVGRAIRGVEVEIDVDGELLVRGPSTMIGYLDAPEDTARVLGPRGLRTGDVGRMDARGYIWVEGRRDGVVKVGGERVGCDEVAAVLRAVPGVSDAVVVAVPDELYGSRLVAFVEGEAGADDAAAREARLQLPPAKRPAKIQRVPAIPRLPTGKPALAELRKLAVAIVALVLLAASPARAQSAAAPDHRFTVSVPAGYKDVSEDLRREDFPTPQLSLIGAAATDRPAGITFLRAETPGGSWADAGLCRTAAASFAGSRGTVADVAIIDGPTGPTCQSRIIVDGVVALSTELNGARESWLMSCNFVEGDAAAESACRETLASVRLAADFGRPDPLARHAGRILDRVAHLAGVLLEALTRFAPALFPPLVP